MLKKERKRDLYGLGNIDSIQFILIYYSDHLGKYNIYIWTRTDVLGRYISIVEVVLRFVDVDDNETNVIF